MKKFVSMVFLLALGVFLYAQTSLTIYVIKGPSGVAFIDLFEKPPLVPGMTVKMDSLAQADQMAARIISGEIKMGILPTNVAAKIASAGKPVQIAAVTGNGMLSLLSRDNAVKSIKDLKGKTVFTTGQGAVPEFVFRKVLLNNKINPAQDVTLDFSLAYPEIAQSLIAGRISTALLPEPFATMARLGSKDIKQAGDIQAEWRKLSKQPNYPMTVLVVNADFAKQNPEAMSVILKRVQESVAWTTAHPAAAGELVEKHGLGLKASVVSASVPRSNFVYMDAAAARPALEALFKTFLEFDPVSIGGKLPDDSFYFALP